MRPLLTALAVASLSTTSAQVTLDLTQPPPANDSQPVTLRLTVGNNGKTPVQVGRIRGDHVACPVFKLFGSGGGPPRIERYITADCDVGETVTLLPGRRLNLSATLPWNDLTPGWYTAILELPVNGKAQYVSGAVQVGLSKRNTPNPDAYRAAVAASRATIYGAGRGTGRLSYMVADERSRQAILTELKKRGLDAGKIDIEVPAPVRFPVRPTFPHTAKVAVQHGPAGYTFTLTVTNTSAKAVEGSQGTACPPAAIERVSDGVRVWQTGNGACIDLGYGPAPLAPGQSVTRTVKWDGLDSVHQPVPPGSYRVRLARGQFVGETVFTVK